MRNFLLLFSKTILRECNFNELDEVWFSTYGAGWYYALQRKWLL